MKQLGLLVLLAAASVARGELSLAPVFTSHLVLQREAALPIWGQAAPGAIVIGEFGAERCQATADATGRWRMQFSARPPSDVPATLRFSSAGIVREIDDVLVGDVWLCSGQSNMEWPLEKELHGTEEIPRATHPNVRWFNPDYPGRNRGGAAFTAEEVRALAAGGAFFGAWTRATPETSRGCSAIGYYFATQLAPAVGVPVGIIQLAVGGSPLESWMSRDTLAADSKLRPLLTEPWLENPVLEAWCRQRAHENLDRALGAGEVDARNPPHAFRPGFLWQSALEPLAPFPLRGVLWYQGESNSLRLDRVQQHEIMFPLFVRDLRARWGANSLPLFYCQLSGIETANYHSEFWPEFRNSQRRLLAVVPNTGMVVTSDVGDLASVHPRDKRTVAARLVGLALAQVYGRDLLASGPQPRVPHARGRELEIGFDSVGAGLATSDGTAVRGFEVAGVDGVFFPAQGRLERTSAVLMNDRVAVPRRVRYNWQPFPRGNLVNAAGLPSSTFEMEAAP